MAGTEARASSVTRSRRRSSPTSSLGLVSEIPWSSSMPVHQPLRLTRIAPSVSVAQAVTAYSMLLAATIATRSPLPMPYSSASRLAVAATAWRTSG